MAEVLKTVANAAKWVGSWFGRSPRCKMGLHDWQKTADLTSDSHESTLKLVCRECPAESKGWHMIHHVRHHKKRAK